MSLIDNIDKGTQKALNLSLKNVVPSNEFKNVLANGVGAPSSKTQVFQGIVLNTWESLIYEGKPEEYRKKAKGVKTVSQTKVNFIQTLFTIMSNIDADNSKIDFRVLDREKGTAAFKEDGKCYGITFTQHKKPVTEEPNIGKVRPTIETIYNELKDLSEVVLLKNNQITIKGFDGTQVSAKITQKKTPLF